MRMLLKCSIPVESGNKAIKDGSIGTLLENTFAELKPETAFFGAEGGLRTMFVVFDLKEPSDIPRVAERLFRGLDVKLELTPVMNYEDLKKGLQKVA